MEAWINGTWGLPLEGRVWYTDGSKGGRTGAGIYGIKDGRRISIRLGRLATVFQAEVTAILVCVQKLLVDKNLPKNCLEMGLSKPVLAMCIASSIRCTNLLLNDVDR